ncbi:MAG: hypothetical protein JWM74_5669, partial [Myxococcaceae bacterium]|nr:hypothetical protein [Myxococcaceae bacterium]
MPSSGSFTSKASSSSFPAFSPRTSSATTFEAAQAELERGRLFEAFDLARPELVRLDTVRASDGTHRCIVVVHNGWSVAALVRALWTTYRALCEGREPPPTSWWMGEDPLTDGDDGRPFWKPYL